MPLRIGRWVLPALAGVLIACGDGDRPRTGFIDEEEASPMPTMLLRDDSSRTSEGYRVAELDVLMVGTHTEAVARATLQRVIDSVARVDTLAAAVRVTGFVLGDVDPATSSADLHPAVRATWGPIDTLGFTGTERRSRYRTHYVVLRPFTDKRPAGRGS